ncbi:MAG: thioredoxin domain-containing protein, partial [Mycobacteriales bacterium]
LHQGAAGSLVAVAALLGVAAPGSATAPGPASTPVGVTAAGGVLVGSASAPHRLVAFEDPQCPVCGIFEKTSGVVVARAVAQGKVSVEYRMRSFLGPESVRAVAALGAAAQAGRFEQLREQLFAHQPQEHTGGYTVTDLLALGASAGLTDRAFTHAVTAQTFAAWARSVDDRASRDGNVGTPELRLDDRVLDRSVVFDPTALAAVLGLAS